VHEVVARAADLLDEQQRIVFGVLYEEQAELTHASRIPSGRPGASPEMR
jgi:hypothetical protein